MKVPDLVKMDQDAALALLDSLKLKGSTQPRDSDRPAGEVVDQSPKAGVEVAEGSTVTIWASNASVTPKVKVDDVVGKTRAQAVVILTQVRVQVDPRGPCGRRRRAGDRGGAVAGSGHLGGQRQHGDHLRGGGAAPSTTTTTEPPPTTTTTPPPTG